MPRCPTRRGRLLSILSGDEITAAFNWMNTRLALDTLSIERGRLLVLINAGRSRMQIDRRVRRLI